MDSHINTEGKRQHLEFIQNIITRMNTNSFQLKGIAITIVSALLAFFASTQNDFFVFLGIPPTFLFWLLDTYYLQQERKFKGVYNDVAGLKTVIEVKLYEMPVHKYTKKVDKQYSYCNVFFSKTIFWLYFSIISFLAIIGFILKYSCLTF